MKKVSDGAGGLVDQGVRFPIWLDPTANGGTPMCAAFDKAYQVVGEFLSQHPDCFKFDGCGISCDLGGEDNHTLFMTAFVGPEKEVLQFTRRSAMFTAKVAVGAA